MNGPHRALTAAAVIGIGGWFFIMAGWLWWTFQPVSLPDVETPIPVLNAGHVVAIGSPIVLKLEVDKPTEARAAQASRFLQCESGNLVTLTSSARDLPVGTYTIISDNVVLPAKVSPGDVCVFTFRITYDINPIRSETLEWDSEPFTTAPAAP